MKPVGQKWFRCFGIAAVAALMWSAPAARGQLVISQIFGAGGGNAGAANGDFVEIFNRSCIAVDLSQYSLQVAGIATSTTWQVVTLPHRALDPGQYFCIRITTTPTGVAFTADLTAPATVGDILQASSGKAAIVLGNSVLPSVSCPPASAVVDLVVYASTSGACTEGPRFNPSSALAAGRGYQRKLNGCQDTNNNLNDFVSDTNPANPRTSTSAENPCSPQNTYGGCTLPDQSCQAAAGAAACTALGGTYLGDCQPCEFAQACCLPTSPVTCQLLTSGSCTESGGLLGAGQLTCPPTPACPGVGRCCATDGTCTVTFSAFCNSPSTFSGVGTVCTGTPCLGRCCDLAAGNCSLTTSNGCISPSVFGGTGTTCTGTPCQGACCEPVSGSCTLTGTTDCQPPSTFAGVGTTCTATICQGRCCAPNGDCALTGPDGCTSPNVFGGLGSACTANACTGRCCHADGTCELTGSASCQGTFGGIGTSCSGNYSLTQGNNALEDISGTGTELFGVGMPPTNGSLDDGSVILPLPFAFSFYGIPKTSLQVTTNGYMTFDTAATSCCLYGNAAGIPATSLPNDMICPPWDDYYFFNSGTCKWEVHGVAPNQRLIVQITNCQYFPGTAGTDTSTFQAILYETTNVVEMRFGHIGVGAATTDPNKVVGLENSDGTVATSFPDAQLADGLSLTFTFAGDCPIGGCTCHGDANGDNAVNGKDIKAFANCVAAGGAGCPCADMDNSGTATSADIAPFIAAVIAGACAP